MAEILGLVTGIFSVIKTAESITATLGKIKNITDAPAQLLALINEVSDLTVLLADAERHIRQIRHASTSNLNHLQNLKIFVDRAKEQLQRLEELIHYKLTKPESTTELLKVSFRNWMKEKGTIEEFRQGLRDARLNIATQMALINSAYQSRIALTIDDISVLLGKVLNAQDNVDRHVLQSADEVSKLLTAMSSPPLEPHIASLIPGPVGGPKERAQFHPKNRRSTARDQHYSPLLCVHARYSDHERCDIDCESRCHIQHSLKSFPQLAPIIGSLFIGYSGLPQYISRRCTMSNCRNQSAFCASVTYVFPWWVTARVFNVSIMARAAQIRVSLSASRIVPSTSQAFILAQSGDLTGLQKLFSKGTASPYDVIETGTTLIKAALLNRRLAMCRFLQDCGADPCYAPAPSKESAYERAWNWILTRQGSQRFLEDLKSLFPKNDQLDDRGFQELHKIVLGLSSQPLRKYLLTEKFDVDATDANHCTALSYAAWSGDHEIVRLLLIAGADPDFADECRPPLHSAAAASSMVCVKLLLEAGAKLNVVNRSGWTALHMAVFDEASLEYLIGQGAAINVAANNGVTPLHSAVNHQHYGSVKILLKQGAVVNTVDSKGESPVLNSIYKGSDDITELLLDHGADYTVWLTPRNSALHLAAIYGSLKTLRILKAHEVRGIDPDALNHEGKTAVQLAQGREKEEDGFVEELEELEELLEDIRTRNYLDEQSRAESSAPSPLQSLGRNFGKKIAILDSFSIAVYLFLSLGWVGFAYVLLAGRVGDGERN